MPDMNEMKVKDVSNETLANYLKTQGYEISEAPPVDNEIAHMSKWWEDLGERGAYWLNARSEVNIARFYGHSDDKNLLPTREIAEQMLAMCQLLMLREEANQGWVPDWTDGTKKYCIGTIRGQAVRPESQYTAHAMAFKSVKIRDTFMEYHKDLLEQAGDLL